jgi:autotransporter translocation and assembly factor TamB
LRSGRGTARVSGSVLLEELTRPRLDLRIEAREFHAASLRDFLELTTTADLQLTGPPLGATLTGEGTATRGVLHFADLITKQVINLEDPLFTGLVDVERIREQRLGTRFQQRFLDSLRVDSLRVRMGNEVWLRSSEANIQLAGELTVNKFRNEYRLTGTLQALRGTYRLPLALGVTREFTVTGGELRYLFTPDLNADVAIDARHEVRTLRGEEVTVFVHIGGTLYDPRLTLSSDFRPALSDTEIISYLLFGAPSVQALRTDDRAENASLVDQSVTQLSGVLSGQIEYALISNLGVPLDYVQIRPGDFSRGLSGTEIAFGKQFQLLGTTAFLTATPRICAHEALSGPVGASLEFRLTRQWRFAASADPLRACDALGTPSDLKYQFGLDLFWEKSY